MTAQTPENLIYEGTHYSLSTEPLQGYFKLTGVSLPKDLGFSTALWRRYIGTWEIINDHLYLVKIETLDRPLGLDFIFPGFPSRVFAHWYSGELRAPHGQLLQYVHGGYDSIYERDLLLNIKAGILVSQSVRVNSTVKLPIDAMPTNKFDIS